MADSGAVRQSVGYGLRWIWFLLACIFWRIVISLAFLLAAFVIVAPPVILAGIANTALGSSIGAWIGILGGIGWIVALGALGVYFGFGYPRVSLTLEFHSPSGDEESTEAAGDDDAFSPD